MERPVMFVQSLLVLLMAIHVTSACTCSMLTWEGSMCPDRNKTVVLARVLGVQFSDANGNDTNEEDPNANGRYNMHLDYIFKNGTNTLKVDNNGTFVMMFPQASNLCGRGLTVGEEYIFAGIVHKDGVFYSNMCQLVLLYSQVADDSASMSLLMGQGTLNCGSD